MHEAAQKPRGDRPNGRTKTEATQLRQRLSTIKALQENPDELEEMYKKVNVSFMHSLSATCSYII
jgi:cell shape-determining protein MreC